MSKGFELRRHAAPADPEVWERDAPVGGHPSPAPEAAPPEIDPLRPPASRAHVRRVLLKRRSWEGLDPFADPSRGMHVRLNPYELAIFQAACELEDRAQQRVARKLLRAWAEERLGIDPSLSPTEVYEKEVTERKTVPSE